MREFYFKERSRYIIGPWTYTFVLQAATQVSPGTGISAEAAEEAQGTENNAGGDGGIETDDDDEEHHDSDKYDSDGTEKKAESGQKRYRKLLHSGSNAVAHALVKRCMGLWMRDAIGPLMGEGPATAQRNAIAIQAIKQFKIRDLHDFTVIFTQRSDNGKALERLCNPSGQGTAISASGSLCISRSLTHVGLAVQ
jgi:hypothetical protein